METLTALGLLDALRPKIVEGESIAQTFQFAASGGAEVGFVALSQVVSPGGPAVQGSYWVVPANLHAPIEQDAVLLRKGAASAGARALLEFLTSARAREVIRSFGYEPSAAAKRSPERDHVVRRRRCAAPDPGARVADHGDPARRGDAARTVARDDGVAVAVLGRGGRRAAAGPAARGARVLSAPVAGARRAGGADHDEPRPRRSALHLRGLLVGSTVYSLPFVVEPLENAFRAVGRGPLEVAATLGAGPWDRFFSVAMPLSAPGYATAAVLGFAHTVGEFGVVLMIGGNIPGKTRVLSRWRCTTTSRRSSIRRPTGSPAGCWCSRWRCWWRCGG